LNGLLPLPREGLVPATTAELKALRDALPRDERGQLLKHPDPRLGGWLKLINPGGPSVEGRNINCPYTTYSFLRTWYRWPDVAPARMPGNRPGKGLALEEGRRLNDMDFTWRFEAADGMDQIEAELRRAGHGHAAQIGVEWKGTSEGRVPWHEVAAVNQNGHVLLVDAQTGIATRAGRDHRWPVVPDDHVEKVWVNLLDPDGDRYDW
jgi:hypothetical protein